MKTGLIRLVVAGMMVAGFGVAMAKEGAAPKADKAPAKAKTWKGDLSAPAAEAGADVVAVLTVKKGEESKTYNLTATDAEVVAKIKEATGTAMTIAGEMNAEETAIAVTKVTAPAADKPKSDKPAKAAGDKPAKAPHNDKQ